ncbi:putative thiosulfate sulfurtransferase [Actinacidiphila reveromycinica]|uniref:Putative thiosulfate sulfurtransferase n=1 Tax=Actinacidiphila reveromycinica TaxID=659352 RepID=A0A7U3UMV1_9ACTN|nr:sulfurtransferase [Streptomyces sp. SN-593]BBA95481.1 putative thiosulfate sulfurtransferase [Streptomyces sp. SN-593]
MTGTDTTRRTVLTTAAELERDLASPAPPVLLDVRWAVGATDGRPRYRAGHLPGARFVDLETELAAPPAPALGRHPLPSADRLQAAARGWGVRADSRVVVYDDTSGLAAARAWWLLRWGGVGDVRLLDGGLGAWTRAGGPLESGEPAPAAPGDVELAGGLLPVLDAPGAARLAEQGVLLDARAAERYRGEVEPVDAKAGHVPGAVSAPTTDNLAATGEFLDTPALRERFRHLGATGTSDVGVYCGSGVTAAHEIAALAAAGVHAALYAGSWSQWIGDPDRPVVLGPTPQGGPS